MESMILPGKHPRMLVRELPRAPTSMSSHSSCNQLRILGGITGVSLESWFSFDSRSVFIGSSEVQPLVGLNSTVDPSLCRHLKQKFTGLNSKQIAC
jgi:hypothetical protein